MSDTLSALQLGIGNSRSAEDSDRQVLVGLGAALLALFLLMVMLLPFDAANALQHMPTIFAP